MSFFKSLFKETKNHGVNKKHLKKISHSCPMLKSAEQNIPAFNYPAPETSEFKDELNTVIEYYNDACLNSSFLSKSHKSVENTFKSFLSQEYAGHIDWSRLSKLLEEVDAIIMRLKYRYQRPRPRCFLINIDDDYFNVKDSKSFSFPSGHTAIAYFLAEILSNDIPDLASDFRMLASLIGQSRIENAVHYPSDVLYGRFVGEML